VRYCSKEHQLAAWSAGHKSTCGQPPPTLTAVAQSPNAAAVLSVLSEFGASPAHDGLIQTALFRMGGLRDASAVFTTEKGLRVLETIMRKQVHNPDIIKRACASVGVILFDSNASGGDWFTRAGGCLRAARAGVTDAMLDAIRAWQSHASISWVGFGEVQPSPRPDPTQFPCSSGSPDPEPKPKTRWDFTC
jgi:hypothetical protein